MFESRAVVRSLYKQARARSKVRAIRILRPAGMAQPFWLAFFRLLLTFGVADACTSLPLPKSLAAGAGLGLLILGLRWDRVAAAASVLPPWTLLYPALAERIWQRHLRLFLFSSLWSLLDAIAVISYLAMDGKISVPWALASIPSAFAYGALMITLPLLLALDFRSFRPVRYFSHVFVLGCASLFTAKFAPALFALVTQWWATLSWVVPLGWLYRLEQAPLHPTYRLLLGCAALAISAGLIKPLAAALERRIVQREEDADAQDAIASNIQEIRAESRDQARAIYEPVITPLGAARTLLEGVHWGSFSPPKTLMERFFWRTLNERQRLVARLIWPFGLHWNKPHRALFIFAASCLAIAGAMRLLLFPQFVWIPLAVGAIPLLMFAPTLPGYQFVFQALFLGGRNAARCQLLPVTVSEISAVLHKCQLIRAAGALWIGAIYGASAWLIVGQNIGIGVSAGLFIIFLGIGFHPFALMAKLSSLTHHGGRRWTSIPFVFICVLTAIVGLIGIISGIGFTVMLAVEPQKSLYFTPIIFGLSAAWRLIGRGLLKIYLFMFERSWSDAVVKIPNQR